MKAQTPDALWNCISELCSLARLNVWFEDQTGQSLLGEDGKLLFPLCRRLGFRFSRTVVPHLSVCKHGRGLYSIYESRDQYEARRHFDDWRSFAQGTWTQKVPTESGLYFCRSLEGYQSVRRLVQLPTGQLHDVSGGYVTPGLVTQWAGDWWTVKVPLLRDAR